MNYDFRNGPEVMNTTCTLEKNGKINNNETDKQTDRQTENRGGKKRGKTTKQKNGTWAQLKLAGRNK